MTAFFLVVRLVLAWFLSYLAVSIFFNEVILDEIGLRDSEGFFVLTGFIVAGLVAVARAARALGAVVPDPRSATLGTARDSTSAHGLR